MYVYILPTSTTTNDVLLSSLTYKTSHFLHVLVEFVLFILWSLMVVYSTILHTKTMFGSSLYPFVLSGVHVSLLYLYLFMHTVPFLCQMMFLSFNSNTTGLDVEKELESLPEHMCSHQICGGVHLVALSLDFCVVICRPVFCVVICRPLFFLFPLVIVLSVLLFTAFDYPFGIFKLFFLELLQIIL